MSRSSASGQVEPLAALAAVFAVTAGLGIYAGVLGGALPTTDRSVAPTVADRVHDRATDGGAVVPDSLSAAAAPRGYRLNATLTAADRRWQVGRPPPDGAASTTRRVSVRLGPARVRPGRLRVVVWR